MNDELDMRGLLRNVAAAQALTSSTPGGRAVAALQDVRRAEAEAPSWFDGKPARRLLAYVGQAGRAGRVALLDAADKVLTALCEEDCASLVVLHPVLPAESLSAYAQRCEGVPGWGLASDWSDGAGEIGPQRLVVAATQSGSGRVRLNLGPTPSEQAASGAAAWLGDFWRERLKAGRLDGLDCPPGLPPGAVLGLLDEDAARLWPDLHDRDAPASASVALSRDGAGVKARRAVGEVVPGLPSDDELARELRAEQAIRRHGATQRLADKYGCSRSTIQRRTKAMQAAAASIFAMASRAAKRR